MKTLTLPPPSPPLRFVLVNRNAPRSGCAALRAGWGLTAVTAALGLGLAVVLMSSPAGEWWSARSVRLILEIAAWTYFPALLLLSALAVCQGAPRRALLLLVGAPVLLHGMDMALSKGLSVWKDGILHAQGREGEKRCLKVKMAAESSLASAAVSPSYP
jgi:hypothetical protein